MKYGDAMRRPASTAAAAAAIACAAAAACVPVEVRVPEPININLNVNIRQEVVVRLEGEARELIDENPDLF
jgi:cobalamin biosynthesis protein CbiD